MRQILLSEEGKDHSINSVAMNKILIFLTTKLLEENVRKLFYNIRMEKSS